MGSSALFLTWKRPERPNGILIGYKVYYQIVEGTSVLKIREREPHIKDPEATKVKLAGLKPETEYRVHVVAITRVGEGAE